MFDNLGGLEILGLILAALFIIGPERLPKVLSDSLGFIRRIRTMARDATSDLSKELGTDLELEDLHPKTFLRKHLLSEAEEDALRKPFQDAIRDVRSTAEALNLDKPTTRDVSGATTGTGGSTGTPGPALRFDDAT